MLPENIKAIILDHTINENGDKDDTRIWEPISDVKFSVSIASDIIEVYYK